MNPGWLFEISLLDSHSVIRILTFFRIGILHSKEHKIMGLILGLGKLDIRMTFAILDMKFVREVENTNAGNA